MESPKAEGQTLWAQLKLRPYFPYHRLPACVANAESLPKIPTKPQNSFDIGLFHGESQGGGANAMGAAEAAALL
ncbi:hypothetical protein J3R74_002384 [Puniceicoccus vermicola]